MCAVLDAGKLVRLEHCTEEDAKNNADFIMAAEANTWKRILRKLDKFVGAFMGQRIKLEKGNTVKALGLAPHANTLVDSLTQVELKFPDELSPEELSEFKNKFAAYRADKGL
jgi:putative sterol carrier protein